MELDDIVALLVQGESDLGDVEPVHVQAARKRLRYAPDFVTWARKSALPAAVVETVLVPEELWSCARPPKQPDFASRNILSTDEMRALLFLALAHRSWPTIKSLMISFGTAAKALEHYRAAHKCIPRAAIRGEHLCVYCAQLTAKGGCVTGLRARMKDNVLRTIGRPPGPFVAMKGGAHFDITPNTTFGDIAERDSTADIRFNVFTRSPAKKRKRSGPPAAPGL